MTIKEARQQLFGSVKDYSVIGTSKAFTNIMEQLKESIYDEYKIAISQSFLVEGEEYEDDEDEDGDEVKPVKEADGEGEGENEEDDEDDLNENPLVAGIIGTAVVKKLSEADADIKTPEEEDKKEVDDKSATTDKKSNTNGKANRAGK